MPSSFSQLICQYVCCQVILIPYLLSEISMIEHLYMAYTIQYIDLVKDAKLQYMSSIFLLYFAQIVQVSAVLSLIALAEQSHSFIPTYEPQRDYHSWWWIVQVETSNKLTFYSSSSNSVPENIPQVPLRIHAVPESTSSVITLSCLGFTVRWRHTNCKLLALVRRRDNMETEKV